MAATFGNKLKSQRMIAAIPFLFGVQQAAEGMIWQTMGHGEASGPLYSFGVLLYLGFANVIWPSWLPWSIYKLEKNEKRKRILRVLGIVGSCVSVLAAWMLFSVELKAFVSGHSLGYDFVHLKRHWPPNIEFPLYLSATMVPFFVSSLKTVKRAGYLIFASMIIAQFINQETTTSVWCFFAALISFYVAANILWQKKAEIN
jgi:hypothetical protein